MRTGSPVSVASEVGDEEEDSLSHKVGDENKNIQLVDDSGWQQALTSGYPFLGHSEIIKASKHADMSEIKSCEGYPVKTFSGSTHNSQPFCQQNF